MNGPNEDGRARRLAAEFDALERREHDELDALATELRALGRDLAPAAVDFDALWARIADATDDEDEDDVEVDGPPGF